MDVSGKLVIGIFFLAVALEAVNTADIPNIVCTGSNQFAVADDYLIPGNNTGREHYVKTLEDCKQMCLAFAGCKSFDFYPPSKRCIVSATNAESSDVVFEVSGWIYGEKCDNYVPTTTPQTNIPNIVCTGSNQFAVADDYLIPGNNAEREHYVNTLEDCKQMCLAFAECKSFDFYPPSTRCMVSTTNAQSSDTVFEVSGWIYGEKCDNYVPPTPPPAYIPNIVCTGSNQFAVANDWLIISNNAESAYDVNTLEECEQMCLAFTDCKSFEFFPPFTKCHVSTKNTQSSDIVFENTSGWIYGEKCDNYVPPPPTSTKTNI